MSQYVKTQGKEKGQIYITQFRTFTAVKNVDCYLQGCGLSWPSAGEVKIRLFLTHLKNFSETEEDITYKKYYYYDLKQYFKNTFFCPQ
jgi:hypothetical protein